MSKIVERLQEGTYVPEKEEFALNVLSVIVGATRAPVGNVADFTEQAIIAIAKDSESFCVRKVCIRNEEQISPCEVFGTTNLGIRSVGVSNLCWTASWQFFDFRIPEVTWRSNRRIAESALYPFNKKGMAARLKRFCRENPEAKWRITL